jgi:hypothetical protein
MVEDSYEIAFDLNHLHLRRFGLRRAMRCRHDHEITRDVVSAGTTAADLLAVLEQRFGQAPVRLEGRRGVGRFLTPESLRQRGSATLAELGLAAGDRLRARGAAGSVWLAVQ